MRAWAEAERPNSSGSVRSKPSRPGSNRPVKQSALGPRTQRRPVSSKESLGVLATDKGDEALKAKVEVRTPFRARKNPLNSMLVPQKALHELEDIKLSNMGRISTRPL